MAEKEKGISKTVSRKGFIRNIFMWGGLLVSYGTFGAFILRYLTGYRRPAEKKRLFVVKLEDLPAGHSKSFSTPDGESYLLTDRGEESAERYVAFSNTCPHLGCKVHWEEKNNRYLCPCHMGVFNPDGIAIAGPPYKEGKPQSLKKCELSIKDGVVYALYEVV